MSDCGCGSEQADKLERSTLIILLLINGAMFLVEFGLGWWAQSAGLIADSLDMLADAAVYAISLYAVGKALSMKVRAAQVSGVLQIILGLGVLLEVLRRVLYGSEPQSTLIMLVGGLALFANVMCLALISKHKEGGVHMRASWIFSTNDVIANVGVIISGGLVALMGNRYPDLIIGSLISLLVIRGGVTILQDAKREASESACGG